jgi:3-phosphoshikimate 1-carboxyvinyltransferase
MTDSISMQPAHGPVRGSIRPPGSKSITNRALVCAALAEGTSTLTGALASEDTQRMIAGLRDLGIEVSAEDAGRTLIVDGCGGGVPSQRANLSVGNSGTTIRFLTPLVALGRGAFRLDGIERMRARPIGDLLDALTQLGADARSELENGCPPVVVHANGLPGGEVTVRGDVSSQFLSGLLMVSPYAGSPVSIRVAGELVSKPYVRMTLGVMREFGVRVRAAPALDRFDVQGDEPYGGRQFAIEPDASAASYFWAAAAITGGEVTVDGLSDSSLQGDIAFCDCLTKMGCELSFTSDSTTIRGGPLRGIDVDMNEISDTVQTLAVVALFADGPTTIRNVGHIRHKETDRLAALATELQKLGARVDERPSGLVITPGELHGKEIATYGDHRMAMSFALAGLRVPGVAILDPRCTRKTYPGFFDDLAKLAGGTP